MERVERNGLAFSVQAFPHCSSNHRPASSPFNSDIGWLNVVYYLTLETLLTQSLAAITISSSFFPFHNQTELLCLVFLVPIHLTVSAPHLPTDPRAQGKPRFPSKASAPGMADSKVCLDA